MRSQVRNYTPSLCGLIVICEVSMVWNDELYAAVNGIPKVTYNRNKSLPFEQKLKLPAVETIAALYLTKERLYEKPKRRNKKSGK